MEKIEKFTIAGVKLMPDGHITTRCKKGNETVFEVEKKWDDYVRETIILKTSRNEIIPFYDGKMEILIQDGDKKRDYCVGYRLPVINKKGQPFANYSLKRKWRSIRAKALKVLIENINIVNAIKLSPPEEAIIGYKKPLFMD